MIKKTFTSKKNLPCVLIYSNDNVTIEAAIIQRTDGTFGIHKDTNTIETVGNFNEQPFINAYNEYKQEKETIRIRKEQERKEAEEKRIANLKERIKNCETPQDLIYEFNFNTIGKNAIKIYSLDEIEIIELAKNIHNISGEWAGYEYNSKFSKGSFYWVYDLENFQENIKNHYYGNDYFYKSPETEAEFYTDTLVADILKDSDLDGIEKLEAIKDIVDTCLGIEAGYYDCNGNLVIEEKTLNAPDFLYCSEDTKSWQFCFKFEYSNSFNNNEE